MSTALKAARQAAGWTKPVLIARLRQAGALGGARVAQPQGLRVMLAGWENGYRQPSELYQRLLCQVYGRSGTELGFTTQPHQVDAGTGGAVVGDPDALAALLYVAPLDTAALAAVCPAQARFYAGCVLGDPRCPPAAELAAGLARVRDTAPAWLDRARLGVSTALAREARTAPDLDLDGGDGGRVPGWLRATRLHGCGITAHLFTLPAGTDRPDLAGWSVPARSERPAASLSKRPETSPTGRGGCGGAVPVGEAGRGRPACPGQHPPPVPAARDDAR